MIQLLRGTKQQLNSYSTIIPDGQPVFEKDTGQLKIGNGASMYSALPYVGASGGSEYPKIHVEYSEMTDLLSYPLFRGYVDFNDKLRYLFGVTTIDMSDYSRFYATYLNKNAAGEDVPSLSNFLYGVSSSYTSLKESDIPFCRGKIIGGSVNALQSNLIISPQMIVNQGRDSYDSATSIFSFGAVESMEGRPAVKIRYDIWCLDILSTDVPYDSSNS